MADQLFDDYGIGTGSRNLFGGGMSKQELDQLLGLSPLSRTEVGSGQAVPTAEALSTVEVPYRDALDAVVSPADNFQPVQLFAPSTMDLSAFMPSDLRNNEMTTQDPREYFTSGQPALAAPTSVLGMFPEVEAMQRALYQQKQNEAMQAQAMQFARLSPMEQAQYSLYMGGQQLGGAIGSALGGKDPQLQMIGLTQQIAQGTDLSNPQSLYQAAQRFAQIGNLPLATSYADRAKVLQESLAKREKEQAETEKITQETTSRKQTIQAIKSQFSLNDADATAIANNPTLVQTYLMPTTAKAFEAIKTGKVTPESAAIYAISGNIADLDYIDKLVKPTSEFITKAVQLGFGEKGKIGDYSQDQVGKINTALFNDSIRLREAGATVLPGARGVGDLVGLRKNINETVKPFRDAVNAADQAIELADDVLKTGNFASAASLSRSLAKASGETQLSKQDVAAFGGDPSFVGSISDIASRLGTGTPTEDTTRKLRALAVLLKKKNEALEKNEIKQLQTTARISGLYTEDQIEQVFTLRGESKGKTRTTTGGISYTVDEEN